MHAAEETIIRPVVPADHAWVESLLVERWGDTAIVTRGRIHQADALPGFVAERGGSPCGLVTYRCESAACEVISLDSLVENRGIGSKLLAVVEEEAARRGSARVWLITTNDNRRAIGFYQRRGYDLVAVHAGAIAESRRLKPSIPEVGSDGIPLRDEIEFAKTIARDAPASPSNQSID